MTMLAKMRRHMNWLKWSLGIVVLAFIIFYIPDFLRTDGAGAMAGDVIATVEGDDITATEFQRTYSAQVEAYRATYGASMSEELLRQLGIEQQIVQQMVDERAALAEANRLNITVSDEEMRRQIMSFPAFQENGVFIGETRYVQLLRMQRPPTTPAEFEDAIRRQLIIDKLRASLTDWLSIPDKEVEAEYRRRNDKIKLAVVAFTADTFRAQVSPSDADVSTYFDGHKEDFRIPEKRKIKFALIDVDAIRAKTVVPPADVEKSYNDNIAQYQQPEQLRASHILLGTEGKDDATVKAQAEQVLKEAKAGADFAELARKYSEDEASKVNGGDLDYFPRGRMVAEFDQAAFALEPGQMSELVKTSFGYHIIKVTDKRAASTQTLDEVRPQITEMLTYQRATQQAGDLSQKLTGQVTKPEDLDRIAKEHGLTVEESGLFARDEAITPLGPAPEAANKAFEMNPGETAGPLRTPRGFVFQTLLTKQDPYVPQLDEVKDRVRDAVVNQKARELSAQKAVEIGAKLKAGAADFEKVAAAAGLEAKTTDLIVRGTPVPDLGVAPAIEDAAFQMTAGSVSDPITVDQGTAVVKVIEKQETTADQLTLARDRFRDELLADRRARFFSAYMMKAKQKMRININQETLQRVVGVAG